MMAGECVGTGMATAFRIGASYTWEVFSIVTGMHVADYQWEMSPMAAGVHMGEGLAAAFQTELVSCGKHPQWWLVFASDQG